MLGMILHHILMGPPPPAPKCSASNICSSVLSTIADPLLTAMQILIPAAIGISAIHKLMEHRESGGGVLVELITKGGGAILVLQLIKTLAGT